MNITNHIITGSFIAVTVTSPFIAAPLAFISHFVLDAMPHFGYPGHRGYAELFKHKLSAVVIGLDLLALVFLFSLLSPNYVHALLIGLVALAPDVVWPIRYFFFERFGKRPPGGAFTDFHSRIQVYERPWGAIIEVLFFFGVLYLLLQQL